MSFLGYNLVVVPFGLIVNLVVSRYDSALVYEAIRITALVTLGMMLLGTLFPRFSPASPARSRWRCCWSSSSSWSSCSSSASTTA